MNSNHRPILSICIGTYNRKNLLSELIQLILSYQGDEIEVVVCDNASTDGTWEMLEQIEDNRLHCYRNKENFGFTYNQLRCFLLGQGKFLLPVNDRTLLDMVEIPKFIKEMKDIEADAIVASGHIQSEKMNIKSYEDRVCLSHKLGEPGDVIFSGDVAQEYKKKYGSEVQIEDVEAGVTRFLHAFFQLEKWYWYDRRLIVVRPAEVLKDIKVERKSNGYVFTGNTSGQLAICIDEINRATFIDNSFKEDYCRGVIKAYARTLFWTVWRSAQSPELCQRYNYIPPKYTFWLKEMLVWKSKVKKCLLEQNCFNKEMSGFLRQRVWKEYFEFLWFRFCINRVVKAAVRLKHRILE